MSRPAITIADITAYLERRGWRQRGTAIEVSRLWEARPEVICRPGETPPIGPILLDVPDPSAPSPRTTDDLADSVLDDLASLLGQSRAPAPRRSSTRPSPATSNSR